MLVVGLFSRWSASRRRARVLSSAGYLLGMGEVPLFFWLFPIYGCGTKPSTYQGVYGRVFSVVRGLVFLAAGHPL